MIFNVEPASFIFISVQLRIAHMKSYIKPQNHDQVYKIRPITAFYKIQSVVGSRAGALLASVNRLTSRRKTRDVRFESQS